MIPSGIKAGRIIKPYGLGGEVQIVLNPGISDRINQGIPLFIDLAGQRVPYFTESVNPSGQDLVVVKFEFIQNLAAAKKVCGCDVYLDPEQAHVEDKPGNFAGRVVGYEVTDLRSGPIGTIKQYVHSEMNPCWIIQSGNRELIVPAVLEFIRETDHQRSVLVLDLPDGIMDL